MFYYINDSYEDGHVDYIQSPRKLALTQITKEEYEAYLEELMKEESADGNSETETA